MADHYFGEPQVVDEESRVRLAPILKYLNVVLKGSLNVEIHEMQESAQGLRPGVVNHVPPYECVTVSESYADEVMDKAKRNAKEN
jgi:hypothetical protein